jgi:nucleotide-binding universal stress UspA family protein
MYKRILLAYDGSEPGQKALLDCDEIARLTQGEIHLTAVMPPPTAMIGGEGFVYDVSRDEEDRKRYRAILDEGLKRLESSGHKATGELLEGEAVDEIVRHAKKIGAELIVVGHRHLDSWTARWWRGSVSKVLIEHSPCSVLVVITR